MDTTQRWTASEKPRHFLGLLGGFIRRRRFERGFYATKGTTHDRRVHPSGRWPVTAWLLALCTVAGLSSVVHSDEVYFVLPDQYVDREGEQARASARNLRTQFIYSADGFTQLTGGRNYLTKVSFRPDATTVGPQSWSIDRLTVNASVTEMSPSLISLKFADNVTADEITVFDGPWQGGTQNIGPPGGPKEFDIDFVFEPPFPYDPSEGNLLLDFRLEGVSGNTMSIDAANQTFQNAAWDATFHSAVAPWRGGGTVAMFSCELNSAPDGDLDGDGDCDADDINIEAAAIRTVVMDTMYDLNVDGSVNAEDRTYLVKTLKHTWFGDANLDGEFNTNDFVTVLQAGEYEDDEPLNSGWATGDWNGDAEFDTGDLVSAFQDGGFEQGPRTDAVALPEPGSWVLLVTGLFPWFLARLGCCAV